MTVAKMRRLPISGEVCVKLKDKVDHGTIVARTKISGDPEIVRAASRLQVDPQDLQRYMKKNIGEEVAKGEIIAAYTALFGLVKKQVLSPINGTVDAVSDVTGQIVVRGPPIPVEIDAYIPGEVVEVIPSEGAIIETNAAFIQGIFGIGGEAHGLIKMAVSSSDEVLTADHISSDDKESVLIGGSIATLEAIQKGVEVKAACIVTGGITHQDLKTFMNQEIGVAITGEEEKGITLIITEGFGKMRMSERTFTLLKSFEGSLAAVNGATQIRAGVLRPEIIIPHEQTLEVEKGDELASGLIVGTPVRIIRQPYFGAIGKVVNLPIELLKVETESDVRVLQVELDTGNVVSVPRANVEIIER
jgi:hypothetical protein